MSSNNLQLIAVVLALLGAPAPLRAADEEKRILGEWVGTFRPNETISLTFGPVNRVTLRFADGVEKGTYALDLTRKPPHLDLHGRPGRPQGGIRTIVEFLPGDRLRIEDNAPGNPRPARFSEHSLVLKKK